MDFLGRETELHDIAEKLNSDRFETDVDYEKYALYTLDDMYNLNSSK